jgi:hypothetical protein
LLLYFYFNCLGGLEVTADYIFLNTIYFYFY